MDAETLIRALEAVLFASSEPVGAARLEEVFAPDGVEREQLQQALDTLRERCSGRGVELREVAGGYQFRTRREAAPWIARLETPKPVRFSRAAMETLAIAAYRQPVTRAEIEEVRGVDCGGVMKSLLERGLVRILGKKDVPGRPLLYGTTRRFLEVFGLASLTELPSLRDIDEILAQQGEGVAEGGEPAAAGGAEAETQEGEPSGG